MRWYYGWTVIAVAFLTTAVTLGTHAAFGVLLVALVDAMGWARSVVAGAIALTALLWTASAAPLGALFDRWGPRVVWSGAALVAAAGFVIAAAAPSPGSSTSAWACSPASASRRCARIARPWWWRTGSCDGAG